MTHVPKVDSDFRLRKSAPVFDPVCLQPYVAERQPISTTLCIQIEAVAQFLRPHFFDPTHSFKARAPKGFGGAAVNVEGAQTFADIPSFIDLYTHHIYALAKNECPLTHCIFNRICARCVPIQGKEVG